MTEAREDHLTFVYRNWRGEVATRTVIPINIWFGRSAWHPGRQWLMRAIDVEKDEYRDFVLKDIGFGQTTHDGALQAIRQELQERGDRCDVLLSALRDAVAAYGQPGGPWSVPTDPGGWLAKARAAIAKAEGGADD